MELKYHILVGLWFSEVKIYLQFLRSGYGTSTSSFVHHLVGLFVSWSVVREKFGDSVLVKDFSPPHPPLKLPETPNMECISKLKMYFLVLL